MTELPVRSFLLAGMYFFLFQFQKKEIAVENSSASNADHFQNAAFHMRETHMSAHAYPKAELQHLHLFPVLSSRWGLKVNESALHLRSVCFSLVSHVLHCKSYPARFLFLIAWKVKHILAMA